MWPKVTTPYKWIIQGPVVPLRAVLGFLEGVLTMAGPKASTIAQRPLSPKSWVAVKEMKSGYNIQEIVFYTVYPHPSRVSYQKKQYIPTMGT